MKKFIQLALIFVTVLALCSFAREEERALSEEYVVSEDGGEYLISVYKASERETLLRSESFSDISRYIDGLSENSKIIFAGVSIKEDFELSGKKHVISGTISLIGEGKIILDGEVNFAKANITLDKHPVRIKNGEVSFTESEIRANSTSAVVMDYSSGARFLMNSGRIYSASKDGAIRLSLGSAVIRGGEIECAGGAGIISQSSLILSENPSIIGEEYGIITENPITLSYMQKEYSGAVSVKYLGSFSKGSISCVFYRASEGAIKNITLSDSRGRIQAITYFDFYEGVSEKNFGAVYLPFKVDFYSSDKLIASEEALFGEVVSPKEAPKKEGYEFSGWRVNGKEELYDFATAVTKDISVYAKYTLLPPTFSFLSREFTYDGTAKDFGIEDLSHPLINQAIINYAWYKDGALISEIGKSLKPVKVSQSGEYRCTISFTVGTDTATLTTPTANLRIKKATVEAPEPIDKFYNGEFQSPEIYSNSLYTVAETGGRIVGVYPVRIALRDSENYEFSGGGDVAYVDFRILKSENFWTEELFVYDIYEGQNPSHSAHSRFGEVKYLYSDSENGVFSSAFPTLSGKYYCIATVSECENYGALRSEPESFFVIEEKIEGIRIEKSPSKLVYTAFDIFSPDGMSVSAFYNSSRSERVDIEKISLAYQNAESFRYGDSAVIVSYCGHSAPVYVTVNKAEYDVSSLRFESKSLVYNGKEQSIDYEGKLPVGLDGVPLCARVSESGIDVGEYTVTLEFFSASNNYSLPLNMTATLTVLPYEAEVVFSSLEFVYDGSEKCPLAYYTDIYSRKITLRVLGARSFAGEYFAEAICEDKNYSLVGSTARFLIKKADYDFSDAFWSEGDFVYDGREKSVTLSGLPNGVTVVGYTDNKGISASKYIAKATLIYDTANYNEPPEQRCEWEIKKADYSLSSFSFLDSEYIFDGSEKYPLLNGSMPQGLDGISLAYYFENAPIHVGAGKHSVKIVFTTESINYNIPSAIYATVEIKPLGIAVSWTGLEFVFDMREHLPSATAKECSVSVVGAGFDAGSYTATAIAESSDYFIVNPTHNFVILKSENLWLSKFKLENYFEGKSPLPDAESLGGEVEFSYFTLDGKILSEPPTEPGDYYAVAYSDGGRNYLPITSEKIYFSVMRILPVSMSVTLKRNEFSAFERIGEGDITATLENNDGSSTVLDIDLLSIDYISADGFRYSDSHFTVKYLDFSLDIAVSVIKASFNLDSVYWAGCDTVYDGEEKRAELAGLPDGLSVSCYEGGVGTFAGEYPVTAVFEYDRDNYNPPSVPDGTLIIKRKTVEPPSVTTLVYNGKVQKPSLSENLLYKVFSDGGKSIGIYPINLTLCDGENYEFSGGGSSCVIYFEIQPRPITLKLSDIDKYKLSSMPIPEYTLTEGEIAFGDELELIFSYGEESVSCISDNPNYRLTVIDGIIRRHNTLSDDMIFGLFVFFLLLLTLTLLTLLIILKQRDVRHYFTVVKSRFAFREGKRGRDENFISESEVQKKTSPENQEADRIDEVLSVDAERADTLITDSLARDLVRKEDIRIETAGNRKAIVNVDTISENFDADGRVDINLLKERSLIPYDTGYIKVLARGEIDKPLKVYANDFSLSAVKMIALTGGEAIRVVSVKKKGKMQKKLR